MRRTAPVVMAALVIWALPTSALAQAPPSTPPTTAVCSTNAYVCAGLGQPNGPLSAEPAVASPAPKEAVRRRPARRSVPIHRWERRLPRPSAAIICAGTVYEDRLVVIATGEVVQSKWTCIPVEPVEPDLARQPGPDPVPLPAPQEVWDRVPLPVPGWGISPAVNGMTGLATWLWDPNGGAPVTASVDLSGFTATTTAKPVRYEWKMWDAADVANRNPVQAVVSSVPGSAAKPAGSYTYETRGDFTVTQTITWVGTSTFTGPGVNQVVDLGTTTTRSTRSYHVIEVRGVRLG